MAPLPSIVSVPSSSSSHVRFEPSPSLPQLPELSALSAMHKRQASSATVSAVSSILIVFFIDSSENMFSLCFYNFMLQKAACRAADRLRNETSPLRRIRGLRERMKKKVKAEQRRALCVDQARWQRDRTCIGVRYRRAKRRQARNFAYRKRIYRDGNADGIVKRLPKENIR